MGGGLWAVSLPRALWGHSAGRPPGASCPPSPLEGSRPHVQAPGGSATGLRLRDETPGSEPAAGAPGTAPRFCLLSQPPPAWRAPLVVLLLGTLPGRVSSVIRDREGSGDSSSGCRHPVFQMGDLGGTRGEGEQRPGWALEASARSLRWLPLARAACGWMEPPCFPEGGPGPPRAPPPPRGRL